MGASESFDLAITYGKIIFAGSLIIFFINMAIALLRGEGDVKKAMYAIIAGSVLNIVLDPIFIFVFGLGIAGAAYATVLSMAISSLLLAYWLFFRKIHILRLILNILNSNETFYLIYLKLGYLHLSNSLQCLL